MAINLQVIQPFSSDEFFYVSKQEAEVFGIIFPEEDSDNNKNEI